MNGTSGAETGQLDENQSGINTDCAECVKLAEKLEKCKGSAENKADGEASDKSPRTRKEDPLQQWKVDRWWENGGFDLLPEIVWGWSSATQFIASFTAIRGSYGINQA
ncbi:hypothetical protein VF21_06360 [Pseudogymnoascus sp. 05NY08]|nr:hypothetical protein VF21_06360 [Pseudogymnoascus sp. 05NY08]